MRFWPDEAQFFLGHYADLEVVHPDYSKRRTWVGHGGFGKFCDMSGPIACLYLPERYMPTNGETDIRIIPVSPRDAAMELVRHSFIATIVEADEMQPDRLDFIAELVQSVPVRRVTYPSGLNNLSYVRSRILEDLNTVGA